MSSAQKKAQDLREFSVVVFGATGLTGRLVVEQLASRDALLDVRVARHPWAVAGRDTAQLARMLTELQLSQVEIIQADLNDIRSIDELASRTAVVLSCAGPYTSQAEMVIDACVRAGTSYVDLSGEIPLLRNVIDRFDAPAQRAGVQIVQMAGWEATPADLNTLVACRRAAPELAASGVNGQSLPGPGAAAPITRVEVAFSFLQRPDGGVPLKEAVSAGTLSSIVEIIKDPNAHLVGDSESLLPSSSATDRGSRTAALRLRAGVRDGRVLGPVVPVAFLNPPIIYRTAAILTGQRGATMVLADYLEGTDLGPSVGLRGFYRRVSASLKGLTQRLLIGVTRLPLQVRRGIAMLLGKLLPARGSGPSGRYLSDWRWEVRALATATDGRIGSATLVGSGHPGYTATAALIAEVALHMAERQVGVGLSGCLTPGLVLGANGVPVMQMPSLELR